MSDKRPFGVGLISLLIALNGLFTIVVGVLLLIHKGEDAIVDAFNISKDHITAFAIAALVLGALTLIVGLALRSGSNVARFLLVLLWLGNVGILIYSMVKLHALHWSNALWPAVISGLAAFYLLFDKDARQFFAKS